LNLSRGLINLFPYMGKQQIEPENKLIVEIKNQRPVELLDLTDSLTSFAEQYKKFALSQPYVKSGSEARLYIQDIRQGSIVTVLIDFAQLALPIMSDVNTMMSFTKYMKWAYDAFLGRGKSEEKPEIDIENLEKSDYSQLSKIINPIAKDNGSQINISNVFNGNVTYNINLDSISSNAIQNSISRYINRLPEQGSNIFPKVVIRWYQAKNDPDAQTGDKGIIESLSPKPVKTIFFDEEMKTLLLQERLNIFQHGFIVDVKVETIDNVPVLYKIMNIYGRVDK